MATTDTFSGIADYYLEVYAYVASQSASGNYSRIYYRIRVYKSRGGGHMASQGLGNSGWADSNLAGESDLWRNDDLAYEFRNGASTGYQTFAEGYFNVPHRSDGTAEYYINAGMTLYALGTARVSTGTRTLPRLADPPPAPKFLGIDQIKQTSLRYRFTNQGDGGSPVIQWQIGYGTSSTQPQKFLTSRGLSTVTGLTPATTHYFWSRGRNSVGWGKWSSRASARTRAGSRVLVNGVWKEAIPYVKVNGVWRPAEPFVRVSGVWKQTE